jgi:urocanate hydratase
MGLMMYGQMTAGSWIYIGTQGILQGTYEAFTECANQHFGGKLNGRFVLTGGMGGMGGAQPLAAVLCGAAILVVEMNENSINKRIRDGYCDIKTNDLKDALSLIEKHKNEGTPISIGLVGNCAEIHPQIYQMGIVPDVVTDQTSAHDPLNGYYPMGMTIEKADALRKENPFEYLKQAYRSIGIHCQTMVDFQKKGSIVFDYGNNLRTAARDYGNCSEAFNINGFVPEYIRPLFCEGKGPFR